MSKRIMIPLVIFLLLAGGFVFYFFTPPNLKKDKRYSGISLQFKQQPTNKPLMALIVKPFPKGFSKDFDQLTKIKFAKKQKKTPPLMRTSKGWFKDLKPVESFLQKHKDATGAFLQAIQQKGCFPTTKYKGDSGSLGLFRHNKIQALHVLVDSQRGDAAKAAQRWLTVTRALQKKLRTCTNTLIYSMVLLASLEYLYQHSFYILSLESLTADTKEKIAATLRTAGTLSSKLFQDTFRAEHAFTSAMIDDAFKKMKEEGQSASWPLFDRKQTEMWQKEHFRALVWKAGQPFGKTISPPLEVDTFSETVGKGGFLSKLRYNAVGRILFNVARPSLDHFISRWHEMQCHARAILASAHKHTQIPGKAPNNNLTGKPFDLKKDDPCKPPGRKENYFKLPNWPGKPPLPKTPLPRAKPPERR